MLTQDGTDFSEKTAGTNGIGTALALGRPVRIFGAEHYSPLYHDFVCCTAPAGRPRRQPGSCIFPSARLIGGAGREGSASGTFGIRGRIETKRREKTKKSRERKIRSRLFVRRGGEIRTPIGGFGDRSLSPSTTPLFGCCLSATRSIAQRRGSGNGKIKDRLLGGFRRDFGTTAGAYAAPPAVQVARNDDPAASR